MNPSKFNILYTTAIAYVILMLVTKNTAIIYGFVPLLLIYGTVDFRLSLSAFLTIIPLSGVLEVSYIDIYYTIIIVLIYIINLLQGKQKLYKNNFTPYLYLLFLLAIISTVITGYFEFFHVLAILFLALSLVFLISQLLTGDKSIIFIIGNALIISGVIGTIYAYSAVDEFRRLELGENIRQLANIIGIAIILLTGLYYFTRSPQHNKIAYQQYKIIKKLRLIIIIILISGLLSTMSRGVILSVGIGIFLLFFFEFIKNIKKLRLNRIFLSIVIVLIVGGIGFYFIDEILIQTGVNLDLLSERFSNEEVEGGTGIRQKIWTAGITGLEGWQILYGHGIKSFQMLANKNGYNYYAHSFFMDALVTTGVLGISILVIIYFKIIKGAIKYRDSLAFILLVFISIAYMTHGSITSNNYWLFLGMAIGLINYQKNKDENTIYFKSRYLKN